MEILRSEFWVPATVETVWDFMKDSKNLGELSPSTLGIEIRADGFARENQQVEIVFAPLGIATPLKWVAQISGVVDQGEKREFSDVQVSGPFKHWKHRHLFEASDKGTWIRETIEFEMPFGIAGTLVLPLVRRQLESLFSFRRTRCEAIFKA